MNRYFSRITAVAVLSLFSVAAHAQVKETAHLVVTGGPNAGTYDSSTTRGGCTYGLAAPGAWGNQLSDPKDKDPKHFNSLQLIVPSSKKAAAGTGEFFLMAGFGPLMHRGAEYKVETRPNEKKSGSGTVTVMDKGTTGTVKFDVKTADGIRLAGSIDCKSVIRSGN
jgi:hypothetical protein